jgi:hypothetical protein
MTPTNTSLTITTPRRRPSRFHRRRKVRTAQQSVAASVCRRVKPLFGRWQEQWADDEGGPSCSPLNARRGFRGEVQMINTNSAIIPIPIAQHCECYRIVVQPMRPLLHGMPSTPCSQIILGKRERHGGNFLRPPWFRFSARRAREGCGGVPGPRGGSLRKTAHFRRYLVMSRFRPKPTMTHITIAVALIGAAVTLALAIWESQKGKTQGPAIIDNRFASQRQR